MNLGLPDLIGALLGLVLTLMIVSYVIKDNVLFRLAIHIFIGVSAGYATVLVFYNVIWYQLLVPLIQSPLTKIYLLFPPLLLGLWLLMKASPKLSRFGSPVVAFLVGVGAATAISGAVAGTIFPQVNASTNLFDLQAASQSGAKPIPWVINGLFILVGTLTTLAYFHFGVRTKPDQPTQRPVWLQVVASFGQFFIAATLGAVFAGTYAAALAALVERLSFFWEFLQGLLGSVL
jgi:hypothetical protein